MLRKRPDAFSLVEVLVAIAVIAVLISILFPSLRAMREASRLASCGVMQRTLTNAALLYAQRNDNWLPGVNTTGEFYRQSINRALLLEGDTTSTTPTTTYDWISPAIGDSVGLHVNRARRTKQIFEDLGCPSAVAMNDKTWGFSNDLRSDFLPLLENEGIGQVSYLSPAPFHLAGQGYSPTQYERFGWRGPAVPPRRYLPRLDRVATRMSDKVFLADGCRYLAADETLDFDVSVNPEHYGSFTSSSPIFAGSTAYGTGPQPPGWDINHGAGGPSPRRRALSYRHTGRMNCLFFDGHMRTITEEESKTNAAMWHPKGSEFTGEAATEQSIAHHHEGEILY